jgi:hypothetical protein
VFVGGVDVDGGVRAIDGGQCANDTELRTFRIEYGSTRIASELK